MGNQMDYTSVVKIITSDGSGTGFFFRRPNYFITNFHVVEGYRDVTVELQNEERFRASVLLVSQHLDLAIIRVEGDFEKWTPLEFCRWRICLRETLLHHRGGRIIASSESR